MRRVVILLLMLLSLGLAACTPGGPLPLDAETPYNTPSGLVTLRHPADWTALDAFGQLAFFNTDDISAVDTSGGIQPGLITGLVNLVDLQGLSESATLESLADGLTAASPGAERERLNLGGRESLRVWDTDPQLGTVQMSIILELGESRYLLLVVIGQTRTVQDLRPTLDAMAAALRFTPTAR